MSHTRLLVPPPKLPPPPQDPDTTPRWAGRLYAELVRYFNEIDLNFVDGRLISRVTKQLLTNGFSIDATGYYIDLYANAPVTSDAVAAIAVGMFGQGLVIQNQSSSTITIKDLALTKLSPPGDYAMAPDATLTVRWDGAKWVELGRTG